MKKQLFLSFLFMFALSIGSFAQSKMFGGIDLGFSSNDHHSSFNIGPSLGYWLNDNAAIVGSVGFSSEKDKTANPEVTTSGFGIGVQYRHCWKNDNFYFYLAPGVGYGTAKVDDGTTDFSVNTLNVTLSPGISYMLSDKWSINAEMGLLDYTSVSADGADTDSQFSVNTNMSSLSFGLWYHF
ncbi:MAG: porin family protein [Saprospiraceae bacterium]|nr:porin family protein [Saprospiraceae bacterium]